MRRCVLSIACVLATLPAIAFAGPIAVVDSLLMMFYVYTGVVVVLAIVAVVLCRFIRNPMTRALTRLAIVVLVFTPIPMLGPSGTSYYAAAFLAWIGALNLAGANPKGTGIFSHPFLLAYATMFALFGPIVVAWLRIPSRSARATRVGPAQRESDQRE